MDLLFALWYALPGVVFLAIGLSIRKREQAPIRWLSIAAIAVGALMVGLGVFMALVLIPGERESGDLTYSLLVGL